MELRLKYKKILFFILCCLNFYSVIFKDIKVIGYIFYYIIPFIFFLFNYKIIMNIIDCILRSKLKFYLLACFFLGVLSLLLPILYGTQDYSYFTIRILQIAKESIKMIFLLVFFIKYISPEYNYKIFMKYYVMSTCTYVSFTILTIFFPFIREFIINQLTVTEHTARLFNQANYFTRFGWSGFSGFTFTLKATLSVILCLYFIILEQEKNIFKNIFFLVFSFLGNLFYGRIGLMTSGLFILITIIFLYKINKNLSIKIILFLLICFFTLIFIAVFSPKIQLWLYWAFQNFIEFFKTGSFSTTSTYALKDMYILPNIKTFFVGDGYYSSGVGYYMGIDVGLLRPIYFGGIFFQLLRYSTVYICINELIKSKIKYKKYFSFILVLLFIVFELKGEIVFPIISILFVFIILIKLSQNIENKKV